MMTAEVRMESPSDLDLVRSLEERLHDPAIRNAPEMVAALLADDFLEFGRSGGVYGKEDVIRSLSAEWGRQPSELTAHGYAARLLAADVLLLTYKTTRRQEGTPDLHTLRSSVWKLIDGSWQMVFHQGTPALFTA